MPRRKLVRVIAVPSTPEIRFSHSWRSITSDHRYVVTVCAECWPDGWQTYSREFSELFVAKLSRSVEAFVAERLISPVSVDNFAGNALAECVQLFKPCIAAWTSGQFIVTVYLPGEIVTYWLGDVHSSTWYNGDLVHQTDPHILILPDKRGSVLSKSLRLHTDQDLLDSTSTVKYKRPNKSITLLSFGPQVDASCELKSLLKGCSHNAMFCSTPGKADETFQDLLTNSESKIGNSRGLIIIDS